MCTYLTELSVYKMFGTIQRHNIRIYTIGNEMDRELAVMLYMMVMPSVNTTFHKFKINIRRHDPGTIL